MFGINEIINKVFKNKPLSEREKFQILRNKRVETGVIEYLIKKLSDLHIEVNKYDGSLFELMPVGKLEGWCWQTTESAIVFLNDDDYIERGYLNFDEKTPDYYHSWICFKYKNVEYVLDPCLNFLCKKKDYSRIFEINVQGKVSAKAVREELIKQLTMPKEEDNSDAHKSFEKFMKSLIGASYDDYKKEKNSEVTVHGPEDVNTPLYRNGAGYKTEISDGKIKKMVVHYYWTDC